MKKLLTYATPKKIQAQLHRQGHSIPAKKNRRICPKTKGEHDFNLTNTKIYKWFPRTQGKQTRVNEYRCRHCNKKNVEFVEEALDETVS